MSDWKPIHTAPKTGEDIQVYCKSTGEQMVAFWSDSAEVWQFATGPKGLRIGCEPDYWQHTPEAPEDV